MISFLIIVIALVLIFDFINGFHDAANSIAVVVSTKVLTPFQAVLWAAFFNFIALYIFTDFNVATTISKTVHKEFITLPLIFSGIIAAIIWNLLTCGLVFHPRHPIRSSADLRGLLLLLPALIPSAPQ